MRWINLVVVLLLFLVPLVSAEIALDPLVAEEYNYGDKVLVSGEVEVVEDFGDNTFLSLDLQCGGDASQLAIKKLNFLEAGTRESFSWLIGLPGSVGGDCVVVVSLSKNGELLESRTSGEFLVSSELLGNFETDLTELQLGDMFLLKGDVTKLDGSLVNGVAVLHFKQEGVDLLIESVDVIDGSLYYEKPMSLVPSGYYSLDVEVSDKYGNRHIFSDVLGLDVISVLDIELDVSRDLVSPGEGLAIRGIVKSTVEGLDLSSLEITYNFDGEKFVDVLNSGEFKFVYPVPADAKSGEHSFTVVVKDADGNYGEVLGSYSVRSIPTYMELSLSEDVYFVPEEDVLFEVKLLDQAKDLVSRDALVSLFNANGEFVSSKSIGTNVVDSFTLPKYALPGSWVMKVEGFGLMSIKEFVVDEYLKLDVNLVGQVLGVANEGNVLFEDALVVHVGDEELHQKLSLIPNETASVDLGKFFSTGEYDVIIPLADKSFTNVRVEDGRSIFRKVGDAFSGITGSAVKQGGSRKGDWTNFVWLGVVLIIVLGFVGFVKFKKKGKNEGSETPVHASSYEEDVEKGRKRKQELKGEEKKVRKYKFGTATEADVKDFQKRMLRKIEEDEQKRKRFAFQKPMQEQRYKQFFGGTAVPEEVPKKEEKNMFSMFD